MLYLQALTFSRIKALKRRAVGCELGSACGARLTLLRELGPPSAQPGPGAAAAVCSLRTSPGCAASCPARVGSCPHRGLQGPSRGTRGAMAASQPPWLLSLPQSRAWVSFTCGKEMPVPAWEDTAALGPCSGCSQPRVSGAALGLLRVLLPWGSMGSGWRGLGWS